MGLAKIYILLPL